MNTFPGTIVVAAVKEPDGNLPEWYTILPDGWIQLEGEGRVLVDEASFEAVSANFRRRGNDIVVDYEHQTIGDNRAPAGGWIKDLRYEPGNGIQARIDWTREAAGYIRNDEYRYLSPVFYARGRDSRAVDIHSVALTNAPKINHFTPLLAKLGAELEKEETEMEFLKKLAAKLGIKEDADESKVEQAVDAMIAKNTQLEEAANNPPEPKEVVAKEVLEALDLKEEDDTSTVVASIHALKQNSDGSVSRDEFEAVKKELRERDAREVVAKAIADGKVSGEMKDWAMDYARRDLKGFKTFAAKAAPVIPKGDLPDKKEPADTVIDDAVLSVAKLMGNSEDDLKQFGARQ